jgi:competence protein ComEA
MNKKPRVWKTAQYVFGVGAIVLWHAWWPKALEVPCAARQYRLDSSAVLTCDDAGTPLPALALMTLGQRPNLNTIAEAELGRLPGIGKKAAKAVVDARNRREFSSWADVEAVRGIGLARLTTLMELTELGAADAGLW